MDLFLIIPLSITILVAAHYLFQRLRFKLPPGPNPWPVIGNIYDIKPIQFRCFHELAQTYGPIFSFTIASELNVVVSNAELAKEVLKVHDQSLCNRHRSKGGRVTEDGVDFIWADYGPYYVKARKVCSLALFNPKAVDAYRPNRENEVNAMVELLFNDCTDSVNKGKPLTIRRYLEMLSFNNITRSTFGKRFINSKGEIDSKGKEIKSVLNGLMVKSKRRDKVDEYPPCLRWLLTLTSNRKKDDQETTMLISHQKNQIIRDMVKDGAITNQCLLGTLLTLKEEYDLNEEIISTLCWMIIAGSDTIVITIEWALTELLRNPRVQKKAQEELDENIGNERIMTEEDFSNLPYLQAIAKESLRLHPPTPLMLPHKAKTHVKIGGYDVPKGSIVHVNVWALGRDPNIWDDVNEFRPERFLEEDVDVKGHDFRLLPFGAGRRTCPATQVGVNLLTSTLGHLLHHFDWKPPNGVNVDEIDMSENPGVVTYMSTPLQAIPIPRLTANLYKCLSSMNS
ncbi:Cytochrome P450 98A2 [Bienertia sinuspersici]